MRVFALFTLVALMSFPAFAGSDVDEIVKKTNHTVYYQGRDGRALVTMTIRDAQGRTRVKELSILRYDVDDTTDGDQNFYVYFHKPADERGVVFMVHKHIGEADDDRWLYLPALDVQKRVAASDKRTSFVGSHFFYEDVSGRSLDEDTHELIEENDTYFVIKNTPKHPETVEFDSYTMWIHKESFIPVEVRYTRNDKVTRIARTLAVDEIDGFKTVTSSSMTDVDTGASTTLTYSQVNYDIGLDASVFTERYLRVAPRALLK